MKCGSGDCISFRDMLYSSWYDVGEVCLCMSEDRKVTP